MAAMNRLLCLALIAMLASGCQTAEQVRTDPTPIQEWPHAMDEEQPHVLAPGDQLEVIVHSAPELTRTVTIGPDGRFRMPYTEPISAAARTIEDVKLSVQTALSSELRNPDSDVLLVKTASQHIFIGGDVEHPGQFDLPGRITPLQAIIMAGGITENDRANTVILIRQMPGGEVASTAFDLKSGLYDPGLAAWAPLRRFDVVYVSRKPIADQDAFVRQYIRDALPIDFFMFYEIAGSDR